MKRESKLGSEYKENDGFIKDKFINHSKVYLELGVPSKNGEFRLFFSFSQFSHEKNDTVVYEFEDLIEMPTSVHWKVWEVKEKVCQAINKKKPEISLDPKKIRFRERNSDKLCQILHNNCLMRDYQLYDKKSIALQRLDCEENTLTEDLLVVVKYWDLKAFELDDPKEIFLKKAFTLQELGVVLSQIYNIPFEDIEACKINSIWTFNRGELLNETVFIN